MKKPFHFAKNKSSRCGGFTLVEILGVMLLIAMLLAITMAAASHMIKTAKRHRINITIATLENAITQYYKEYANDANVIVKWPGLTSAQQQGGTLNAMLKDGGVVFDIGHENNRAVVKMLLADWNSKNINFLDESSVMAYKDGNFYRLSHPSVRGNPSAWLGFRQVDDEYHDDGSIKFKAGTPRAYRIVIYPVEKRVEVGKGGKIP